MAAVVPGTRGLFVIDINAPSVRIDQSDQLLIHHYQPVTQQSPICDAHAWE
jgi:hypothetical protein